MANFPTSLDTSVTIPVESASTPLSTNHVTNHTASQTAIIALETKVGVDGSAVTSSHDYKLGEILTTDKAVGKSATQVLTNKTLTSPTITTPTINGTPAGTFVVPVANGGTGQTTANAALNALVPSQTGNSGKYLGTDGTNTSWNTFAVDPILPTYLASENISANDAVIIDTNIVFGGSNFSTTASGTTLTFNVTTGGINRGLFAWVTEITSSTISSVTYNGVAMTLVTSQADGGIKMYLYYLINPASGTNSLVVTRSGSTGELFCSTSYYNGVNQSSLIDAFNSGVSTSTSSPSATITIASDDSMMAMSIYNAGGNPYTASTNAVDRDCGSNSREVFDCGVQFASGATSMNVTSGTNTHLWIIVSFKNDTTSKIRKGSGTTARLSDAFVGFARSAITAGSTGYVDIVGEITGFTGLTIGSKYYLSNTAGAVSTSAGTVTRKVGIATSSTTLLVTNIW